jgi:hypothetical protein
VLQGNTCHLQSLDEVFVNLAKRKVDFVGSRVMKHSAVFPDDPSKEIFQWAKLGTSESSAGDHEQGTAGSVQLLQSHLQRQWYASLLSQSAVKVKGQYTSIHLPPPASDTQVAIGRSRADRCSGRLALRSMGI